jgi:hypothetical protein
MSLTPNPLLPSTSNLDLARPYASHLVHTEHYKTHFKERYHTSPHPLRVGSGLISSGASASSPSAGCAASSGTAACISAGFAAPGSAADCSVLSTSSSVVSQQKLAQYRTSPRCGLRLF